MDLDYFVVILLVAVFSIIQSVFGMGILVFGTPTLLLLGYDFISVLSYLIPASFVISVFQVIGGHSKRCNISPNLYIFCIPAVGVGLWLTQGTGIGSWLNYIVGGTLIFSAALRYWLGSPDWLSSGLRRYSIPYHLLMGFVHGITNLGGALLAILASGLHSEKNSVRYTIAQYYLAFGVIQLVLLVVLFDRGEALLDSLPMALVAIVVYLIIGNRLFLRTSNPVYYHGLTVFTFAYGIAVLATS